MVRCVVIVLVTVLVAASSVVSDAAAAPRRSAGTGSGTVGFGAITEFGTEVTGGFVADGVAIGLDSLMGFLGSCTGDCATEKELAAIEAELQKIEAAVNATYDSLQSLILEVKNLNLKNELNADVNALSTWEAQVKNAWTQTNALAAEQPPDTCTSTRCLRQFKKSVKTARDQLTTQIECTIGETGIATPNGCAVTFPFDTTFQQTFFAQSGHPSMIELFSAAQATDDPWFTTSDSGLVQDSIVNFLSIYLENFVLVANYEHRTMKGAVRKQALAHLQSVWDATLNATTAQTPCPMPDGTVIAEPGSTMWDVQSSSGAPDQGGSITDAKVVPPCGADTGVGFGWSEPASWNAGPDGPATRADQAASGKGWYAYLTNADPTTKADFSTGLQPKVLLQGTGSCAFTIPGLGWSMNALPAGLSACGGFGSDGGTYWTMFNTADGTESQCFDSPTSHTSRGHFNKTPCWPVSLTYRRAVSLSVTPASPTDHSTQWYYYGE